MTLACAVDDADENVVGVAVGAPWMMLLWMVSDAELCAAVLNLVAVGESDRGVL